jgi:hypothetical protein
MNLTLKQYKQYRQLEKRVEARTRELISEQQTNPPEDTTPEERRELINSKIRKEFPEWFEDESNS